MPLTPSPTPAGTRFPALGWEPLPGATYYRVRVGVAGPGTGTRPAAHLDRHLPLPVCDRYRRAVPAPRHVQLAGEGFTVIGDTTTATDWGPIGTFEVTDLPAVTGQRIALDGRRSTRRPRATQRSGRPRPRTRSASACHRPRCSTGIPCPAPGCTWSTWATTASSPTGCTPFPDQQLPVDPYLGDEHRGAGRQPVW